MDEDEPADEARSWPTPLVLAAAGLACGLTMVALVWLSERGCDRFRGTPDCGALGLPLLILTVVLTIVAGAVLLGRLGMPQPRLVAFLGVMFELLVVVGLLADRLFSTWSLVVVPAVSAIAFLIAHVVAGRLAQTDTVGRPD